MILILVALLPASFLPMLPIQAHATSCTIGSAQYHVEGCIVNYDTGAAITSMDVWLVACGASVSHTTTDASGHFDFYIPCLSANWGYPLSVNGVTTLSSSVDCWPLTCHYLGYSADNPVYSQWAGDVLSDSNYHASASTIRISAAQVVGVIEAALYNNNRFTTLSFAKTKSGSITETLGVSASISSGLSSFTAGYETSITDSISTTNGFSVGPGTADYLTHPSYAIAYYCGGTPQIAGGYYYGFSCTGQGGSYTGINTVGITKPTGDPYQIIPTYESSSTPPPSPPAVRCTWPVPQGATQTVSSQTSGSTSTTLSIASTPISLFGVSVTFSYSSSTSWSIDDATTVTIASTDNQPVQFEFSPPPTGACDSLVFGSEVHIWDTSSPPDFAVSPFAQTLNIAVGSSGTAPLTLKGSNGFNEQVSFTYMAPPGITVSLNPPSMFVDSAGETANPGIAVQSATACGQTYNVYIKATGSGAPTIVHWARVIVNAIPATSGDFCFSSNANTSVISGNPGATGSSCPMLYFTGTTSMTISLSASVPSGITASFGRSTISVTPGATNRTYVCYGLPSGSPITIGTYQSTITGTSGGTVHSIPMSIQYIGDFQLGLSSFQVYVSPGGSGSLSLTATSYDGFSGWIQLSSSSNGPGLSVSMPSSMLLQASYGWSSTSITVYASGYTPVGSYPVTITGTYYAADGIPVGRTTSFTVYVQSGSCGCGGGGGGGPPRPMIAKNIS